MTGLLVVVVLIAVVAVVVRRRLVVVAVKGASMLPTLRSGDRVIVRRVPVGAVRVGDVVVVEEPVPCVKDARPRAPWVVKRVLAAPGDPAPLFLSRWEQAPGGRVPADRLVVVGDNVDFSRDSRHFGSVGADRLLGVVLRRVGR